MLAWLEENQLLTGGLTLMAVGAVMALVRKVPAALWAFLVRRVSISVEIPDRDPAYRWVHAWVAGQRSALRARRLSLTTTWESADPDPDVDSDPSYGYAAGKLSTAKFVLSLARGRTS